jgi:TM2 domain-containing membrane protein YozV
MAYCRACGKALCAACRQEWRGVIVCGACVAAPPGAPAPAPAAAVAPPRPRPDEPAPVLAFFIGLIPGVGAVYNGQYGKGIIHVVVFGLLISIVDSDWVGDLTPLFGVMIPAWILYMAIEAYHTAKKRLAGEPVDEFSSVFPAGPQPGGVPLGPIVLILLGVLFLLNTLGVLQMSRLVRFWPILLIVAGAYWLYARLARRPGAAEGPPGGTSNESAAGGGN